MQPPKEAEEIEELRPLTESMTQMLARLEYSFEQQREFLGNAAHELKTPVAVLKSTLQSLLQRPRSSEEYRAGLQASLQDLDRLEQLLQWMLRLARAEQWAQDAQGRELDLIDINSTCEEAVERIRSSGAVPQHDDSTRDQRAGSLPRRPRGLATGVDKSAGKCRPLQSRRSIGRSRGGSRRENARKWLFRTTALALRPQICPTFLTASIAETTLEPALPEVLAWAWPLRKPWWKPTEEASPPRAPR